MTPPVLQVQSLGVALDPPRAEVRLVDDVSFNVAAGSALGIVGASGAGKSTLGAALMRLLPPGMHITPGSRVQLGDHDLAALDARAMRQVWGQRLAMVFQEPITALNPAMTVGDQLAEAVLVHGDAGRAGRARARSRAIEMLERVGIAGGAEAATRYPHEFSGGMRQRLLLAMPLMLDPLLIIADEPTTALDPVRQAQMLDLLDALRAKSGTALVLITHDLDLVAERCDRVIVLDQGRIVEEGAPSEVLARPRSEAARRLNASRLPLRAAAGPAPTSQSAKMAPAAPLLEAHDLHVTYPERRRGLRSLPAVPAVTSTSLSLSAGEALGVIGESGCGKTSLALALLRLVPSRAGVLRFDGHDLAALEGEPLRRVRRHLQFIPQDAGASLSAHLTCAQLVSEGAIVHGLCAAPEAAARARALLDELGLPADAATRRPRELSSGQRQRVAIARALAVEPKLLICDEPVSAVDPPTRALLLDLLARLRETRGLALLFISHDVPAVARIADRIAVMHQGRIVEEGPADRVLGAPAHHYTRALLAAVPTGFRNRPVHASIPASPERPTP